MKLPSGDQLDSPSYPVKLVNGVTVLVTRAGIGEFREALQTISPAMIAPTANPPRIPARTRDFPPCAVATVGPGIAKLPEGSLCVSLIVNQASPISRRRRR